MLHRLTGFLDLNISIYPLECQGHDYAIRLAFLTCLPVAISAACWLLSWFALRCLPCPAEGREALLSKKSVATVIWLHTWMLLVLLPVLSREYLNHLSCTAYRDPDTGQVVKLLRVHTDIECYGDEWRRDLLLPLVGFLIYCVLCPLLPFLLAARAMPAAQTASLATHMPLLFDSYQPRLWFFEVAAQSGSNVANPRASHTLCLLLPALATALCSLRSPL